MTLSARRAGVVIVASAVAAMCALSIAPGEAHKAITSKYTYNDDVFPILRDRCARCHVAGGVAPMSLMTYDEAFPWAESIRAELVANHMPPWNAEDGFGALKQAHTLSPRELDIILTWATGGNPRGQLDQKLPPVVLKNEWALGTPDLALPMPSEFTIGADKMEDWHEFTVATGTTEPRWVRAADLLPGNPAVVRSATIVLRLEGTASAPREPQGPAAAEHVLARWLPGHDPEPTGSAAFRLPAGAQLVARVHYKKTWQFEGKPMTDRSTIGVYFAKDGNAQELLAVAVASTGAAVNGTNEIAFSRTLNDDVQAVAVSPDDVPANITLQMVAIRPDGSRAPMIRLNTRPDWSRRYWFEKPLPLPRGTRIEVTAKLDDPDILSTAFGSAPGSAKAGSNGLLRLSLNVVRPPSKPAAP